MGNPLGDQLRSIRKLRGLSLAAVAEPAEISTAYLQKLEGGGVGASPSRTSPVGRSAEHSLWRAHGTCRLRGSQS